MDTATTFDPATFTPKTPDQIKDLSKAELAVYLKQNKEYLDMLKKMQKANSGKADEDEVKERQALLDAITALTSSTVKVTIGEGEESEVREVSITEAIMGFEADMLVKDRKNPEGPKVVRHMKSVKITGMRRTSLEKAVKRVHAILADEAIRQVKKDETPTEENQTPEVA